MRRYATRIEGGVVSVERAGGWLEVGPLDAILGEIGGETYVVQYDADDAALYDWLDVDEDGRLAIDVRETIADLDVTDEFVALLADVPLDDEGVPRRAAFFADLLTSIWDGRGSLDGSTGG